MLKHARVTPTLAAKQEGPLLSSQAKIGVICIKWGTAYGPEYVNILYKAVSKHLSQPFEFVCLTDDPTGVHPDVKCKSFSFDGISPDKWGTGMWPKLIMFDRKYSGDFDVVMFLDLDVVIVGPLDRLINIAVKSERMYLIRKRPASLH